MTRHLIYGLSASLALLLICIAVGLLMLLRSVGAYRTYWQHRAQTSGELVYVALGDSAAQGIGASQPQRGYVGLLADSIAATTGRSVRVVNLSVSGATIHDVLHDQIPQLLAMQPDVDLVSLDIGANDVVRRTDQTALAKDYEMILQALPPGRSVISDVPYFGGRLRDDANVRRINGIITGLAEDYRLPAASLYDDLKPRQSPWIYATDLFHPNDRGYRIWHEAFWHELKPVVDDISQTRGTAGETVTY